MSTWIKPEAIKTPSKTASQDRWDFESLASLSKFSTVSVHRNGIFVGIFSMVDSHYLLSAEQGVSWRTLLSGLNVLQALCGACACKVS